MAAPEREERGERADRPALLFYCQHSVGLGHLVRSMILAGGLAERFRVVFLNGGRMPAQLEAPPGVELVQLPPLGHDSDYALVSRDPRWTVDEAKRERRRTILDLFEELRPSVVVVELFPFGRKKFGFELLPLLELARSAPWAPLVVCSLRDILVGRREQSSHDLRASELTNRFFDAVLVHADPRFARLEESFRPSTLLRVPVRYTGFVRDGSRPRAGGRRPARRMLVSAGGGMVGEPLFRAAVGAQPALEADGIATRIVAGPFLPEAAWRWLQDEAERRPGLEVERYVPDLAGEMAASLVTVSQCGYNTTMDILGARTAAVVVPFADGGEDEQSTRARRLERLGVLRVVDAAELDASSLLAAVHQALRLRPSKLDLDLEGRANTARIVAELAAQRTAEVVEAAGTRETVAR